ncbi:hybrid sensor histidine kinase/response regulator transcription factor [Pedobacter cryophilus]|uniref:histidine kinase n=1 Tax=Pedobacter cryophilus TaxID=2571271 RepID=A0A4U1BZI0_9SPHI|nr:hybrid sensor histidine kinase/response regulator transcription factor [Pedobacter cryophilus]TKB98688.1 response regulator [Pedobacter cryophilus]
MKYISFKLKPFKIYQKTFAFYIWVMFFSCPLFAQINQFQFERFTVERGLSQSSVLSIAQDSMGFIWMGTKDGLNRYDSQGFEVYKHQVNDKNSISSSLNINTLLTDSKGNLWVGTQEGLNKYVPETNSFIRYLNQPNNKTSLSNNTIRSLYEDKQGNLWVGTENGLNKLVGNQKFERFFCSGSVGNKMVHPIIKAIYQDSKNILWVGSLKGLVSMDLKNGLYRLKTYVHEPLNQQSLASNDVNAITEDLNHNLWIGTHFNGLDFFDRTNNQFRHFKSEPGNQNSLSSNTIRKIMVNKDGNLWIATLNGINIFDPVSRQFKLQKHDPENSTSISQNSIYDVFQDKAGSVWVGTYYGGVNVYHPNAVTFKIYKYYSYKNSLSSNIISAIVEDKQNNLWIGTEAEGLNYYNRKTGQFAKFSVSSGAKSTLSSNLIKSIAINKNGDLWIAAFESGLDLYSPKTGIFKNYKLNPDDPNSLSANRVSYLFYDHLDRLWIGTKGSGLYQYNAQKDGFTSLLESKSLYHLPSKFINYIFQDQKQNIWVAASNGIFYLSKNGNSFSKFENPNQIALNNVNCIQQDSKGLIWFGSSNKGLLSFNIATKKTVIYGLDEGLPSNNVTSIVNDNEGYLWISTDKGLAKLNAGKFKIYTRGDGLPGNVFNYHSFLKDSKGELFFGGYNGLVSFKPEEIVENKTVPKIAFTRLRLFNKNVEINDETKLLSKAFIKTNEITFSYDQNTFTIDFVALNFVKSQKNKFAYKLDGFENEWKDLENPSITFNNLPNGTYKLLIKGTNNDGIWNSEPKQLIININPPFWKTWWAYLFYTLVVIGLLFIVVRFLLMRALLKREHDIHQMKLSFFTNVSHEIRTPLTLIMAPLEKLIQDSFENRNLNRQLLDVNKNVKRLYRLVNELMDFRKVESGKMKLNVTEDNLVSFIKEIYLSFQDMAFQRNIHFKFESEHSIVQAYFDKDQLEKVVFNLLSNAFKFVPDQGKVSINIQVVDSQILVKVCDNGAGIPKESIPKLFTDFYQAGNHQQRNAGTGIGLALSKRIANLHHGDLFLDENDAQTCFCLLLKTGFNHFKKDELKENIDQEGLTGYVLQTEIDNMIDQEPVKINQVNKEGKHVVLIAEDNLELRKFITQTLSSDYLVVETENGLKALEMATELIPDLIISDVMMPVMDGFELCRNVKTDERTSHIPVVLLTARSGDIHELEGLKTGADLYLTKPFSLRKLQLNIQNLIAAQENRRKKFSHHFTLQPSDVEFESSDEEFLNKILHLLEDNISNSEFNVNQFAAEIGMSTPIFYKKIKALTGLTVNNFIKSIRLKRAVQLLQQGNNNISEIAYMVGFTDAKYFSKEFSKQYGISPSKFN